MTEGAEPAVPAETERLGLRPGIGPRWDVCEGSVSPEEAARACRRRALVLWPRLDASRLARTRGDPWRIARLVTQRTSRSIDEIVAILTTATPACPIEPSRSRRP